ncbi:TPA: hypothetical protein ACIBS5_001448 [Salmonella enterica subsp. diarizonae serovar 60-67:z35:-]
MNEAKHVIALLLEDARRLQQIEPNASTKAHIWLGMKAFESGGEPSAYSDITPFLSRLKKLIGEIESNPTSEDSMARLSAELAFIQTELK